MIKLILSCFIGAAIVYLIMAIRKKETESATPEGFSLTKFLNFLNLLDPVAWAKTIANLFNIRALIIYGLIGIGIYSYAYVNAKQNTPVTISLGYGKEALIEINKTGDALHIEKDGSVHIQDKTGKILKVITVKDVPALQEVLAPYGFCLTPFVYGGASASLDDGSLTGGLGISFYRFYKFTADALVGLSGAYVGTSYQITDNSGVGIALGKQWDGDTGGMLYYRFNF